MLAYRIVFLSLFVVTASLFGQAPAADPPNPSPESARELPFFRVTARPGTPETATGDPVSWWDPISAPGVYTLGKVGIGLSDPTVPFEVRGQAVSFGATRRLLRLWDNSAMAVGVGAGIEFLGKYSTAQQYTYFGNIKGVKANGVDGDPSGALALSVTNNANGMVEVVRVTSGQVRALGTSRFDGPNAGGFGAEFRDLYPVYQNGVVLEMQGNSFITVSGLQVGNLGVPVIRSNTSSSPLYLNLWTQTDVVIGDSSYTKGLRVEGTGEVHVSRFRGGRSRHPQPSIPPQCGR